MGRRGARAIPPRHVSALIDADGPLRHLTPSFFYVWISCVMILMLCHPCFFFPLIVTRLISSFHRTLSTLLLTYFFLLLLWLTRHVLSIPHYFCPGFSFPLHPADAGCSTAAVLIFIFFPPFLHIPFVLVHLYTVHSCPSYSIALRLHTLCIAQHAHTEDRGYFIHVLFCFSACLWYLWYDFMRNRCFR